MAPLPGTGGGQAPAGTGSDPTKTKPPCRTPSAVVRPSPGVPAKNNDVLPLVTLTMVLPVPCTLALLLKLETNRSPVLNAPRWGKPAGTNATPYGLSSPFSIVVETSGKIGIGCGRASAAAVPIQKNVSTAQARASMRKLSIVFRLRVVDIGVSVGRVGEVPL